MNSQLMHAEEVSCSRRGFLTATAALGGGLMLGFGLPARAGISDELTTDAAFAPNAFLRIDRSGKVIFVMPFIEMGQGTYTSIPMLIAEELELDVHTVTRDEVSSCTNAPGGSSPTES